MHRLFRSAALVSATLFAASCGDTFTSVGDGPVHIRVYNNSDYPFDSLYVYGLYIGRIEPAQYAYAAYRDVYGYGPVSLKLDGKRKSLGIIDYVGETMLPPGDYTMILSAIPEGESIDQRVILTGPMPYGPQKPGRVRSSSRAAHTTSGGAIMPDGGVALTGERCTSTVYNPTISDRPGTKVIYFEDAFVFAGGCTAFLGVVRADGTQKFLRYFGPVDDGSKTFRWLSSTSQGLIAAGNLETWNLPGSHSGYTNIGWVTRFDAAGSQVSAKNGLDLGFSVVLWVLPLDDGLLTAVQIDSAAWLLNLGPDGVERSRRPFARNAYASAASRMTNGDYVFLGDRYNGNGLFSTDSTGIQRWKTSLEYFAADIAVGNDNSVGIVGCNENYRAVKPWECAFVRADSSGVVTVTKSLGGRGNYYGALAATADGGFGLAGTGMWNWQLTRVDSAGNVLWSKPYGAFGNDTNGWNGEVATRVFAMPDGGFTVIGHGVSNPAAVRVDADGSERWKRVLR